MGPARYDQMQFVPRNPTRLTSAVVCARVCARVCAHGCVQRDEDPWHEGVCRVSTDDPRWVAEQACLSLEHSSLEMGLTSLAFT